MSSELGASSPCLVKSSKELDWKVCIICQESTSKRGTLVKNPKTESFQKLLNAVKVRASLQDGTYVDIQGYLNNETFIEKKPYGIVAVILMPQMLYPYNEQRIAYSMLFVQEAMLQKNVGIKEHILKWMKPQHLAAQLLLLDLQQSL